MWLGTEAVGSGAAGKLRRGAEEPRRWTHLGLVDDQTHKRWHQLGPGQRRSLELQVAFVYRERLLRYGQRVGVSPGRHVVLLLNGVRHQDGGVVQWNPTAGLWTGALWCKISPGPAVLAGWSLCCKVDRGGVCRRFYCALWTSPPTLWTPTVPLSAAGNIKAERTSVFGALRMNKGTWIKFSKYNLTKYLSKK